MRKYTVAIRQLATNADPIQFETYRIEAATEWEACDLAAKRFELEYPDEDIELFEIFAITGKRNT